MKLSPELMEVTAQPVRGRTPDVWRGALAFADWRASTPASFDPRYWSWDVPLGEAHTDEELRVDVSKVGFTFDLDSAAASAASRCLAQGRFAVHTEFRGRVEDETSVTLPGYPRIDCKLSGASEGRLTLRPDFLTQRDSGLVRFGEHLWNVQSVNNLATQRSSFPLARFGYEFRSGGTVVAAVETAGKGRVWFSAGLAAQEREQLAAAMSALLYYATILEEQDR
ncbi:MAG TPA: hypothetical protein VM146_01820 [Steroidobacteraceae bacterium]|nr:hypothetical protein [Steroidobacteraceae bacterium]